MKRSTIQIGCSIGLGLALTLLGLWLLGAGLPPARADGPWYVDPAGSDGNTCDAPGAISACQTIAAAIGKAASGDTIIIAAGTYTENLMVNKSLAFTGAGGGSTIVDGNNAGCVFYISTSSDVSISDLTIQRGNSPGDGGGIYANGGLTLTNVTVISNTAGGSGGGAYTVDTATLSGGLFRSNHSDGHGGGLHAGSALTLDDTQFISNTAVGSGGGVLAAGVTTLSGGLFQDNQSSSGNGGGLHASSSLTLTMNGTQFIGNTAAAAGGGVCTNGTLILSSTQFISNTAVSSGGGVWVSGAATLSGGLFQGNRCTSASWCNGGGLYAVSTLTMSSTRLMGNAARGFGGGLCHESGDARLVNALFARNSAGDDGAAVALNSGGSVLILHSTIASPTVGLRAAVYVTTGTVGISNTIVASYTNGIQRAGGTVYQDYNLLFNAPVYGTVGGGSHNPAGNPAFSNPASDDYHLATLASAAFNRGVDVGITTDLDGKPRPYDGRFDIGCYEYDGVVYHIYLPLVLRQ